MNIWLAFIAVVFLSALVGIAVELVAVRPLGKFDPSTNVGWIITTFAGNGTAGFRGDKGPAASAYLNFPTDVAVAPDHSVYIADAHNNVVRRVDPTGIITTVAGIGGKKGFSGDNGAPTSAKLNLPEGVYVDRNNNLYIADVINNRIRMVQNLPTSK